MEIEEGLFIIVIIIIDFIPRLMQEDIDFRICDRKLVDYSEDHKFRMQK